MADDQKDRFIQYLAEQHQEDELTIKAMKLVLEDFMVQMKELKDQMASMQSKPIWKTGCQKSVSFANRLNVRQSPSGKNLILPIRNVLETGVKGYTPRLKRVFLTSKRRKMIMMVRMIRFAWTR